MCRTIDSAVCPVCPSPQFGRSVHLNVLNDECVCVQHLHLSIALSIAKQANQELTTLLRPATLGPGSLEVFCLPVCVNVEI